MQLCPLTPTELATALLWIVTYGVIHGRILVYMEPLMMERVTPLLWRITGGGVNTGRPPLCALVVLYGGSSVSGCIHG